jgi:RNA polymerase sigma-70 factor, ECF subfamily
MRPDDNQPRTDEELFASFQASGSEAAFAILWRRHWVRIYRQCLAFAGNPADAEDLTAQAFTLAWREAHRFQGGEFIAWLAVIARNCCINHVRSAWSRRVMLAGDEITAMADQPHDPPGSQEDRSFSAELEQLVNQLPDEQRIAVKLFFIDGYSYQQIASLMECDVKAVKSYLQNAKRRLQLLWFEPAEERGKGPAHE